MPRGQAFAAAEARHPLVGWGARRALERPIALGAPVASLGLRARDGARRAVNGGRTLVGAWFHGLGDRETALSQLGTGFVLFATDVVAGASERDRAWIATDVLPLVSAWQAFEKRERGSTTVLFATDWTTFERWLDRLKAARAAARGRDIPLSSPEPGELPETLFDQAAEGRGGELAAMASVARLAIAGAGTLAAAWGVYAVVRDWRRSRR